jgi:phosphatidylglycerophosphate synthase
VEGGVPFLLAYIILLMGFFLLSWRTYHAEKGLLPHSRWGIWLALATMVLTLTGLTDGGLSYGGLTFWMLAAGVEIEFRSLCGIYLAGRKAAA